MGRTHYGIARTDSSVAIQSLTYGGAVMNFPSLLIPISAMTVYYSTIGWLGHEKSYCVRHRFVEATGNKNENWNSGDFTDISMGRTHYGILRTDSSMAIHSLMYGGAARNFPSLPVPISTMTVLQAVLPRYCPFNTNHREAR